MSEWLVNPALHGLIHIGELVGDEWLSHSIYMYVIAEFMRVRKGEISLYLEGKDPPSPLQIYWCLVLLQQYENMVSVNQNFSVL